MRKVSLSLKARVAVFIVAAVAIHLTFRYVPSYIDRRPRFYPEAWAEADRILREEVGDKAVDEGLFYIPKDKISVPRRGAVAVHFDRLESSYWSNYICHDTHHCIVLDDLVFTTAAPFFPRLVKVTPEDSRQILATFEYVGMVNSRIPLQESQASFPFDIVPVIDRFATAQDKLATAVAAGAGQRYYEKISKDSNARVLTDEEEIGRIALDMLRSSYPPDSPLEGRICDTAVLLLMDYPSLSAVAFLERMQRDRASRSRWDDIRDKLSQVPVAGALFGTSREDWRKVRDATGAIELSKALGGKSRAERADILSGLVFRAEEPSSGLRYCPAYSFLRRHYNDELADRLAEHWQEMAPYQRASYVRRAGHYGGDLEKLVRAATSDEDGEVRFEGYCLSFATTGSRASLDTAIALVPLWKGEPDEDRDWTGWGAGYNHLADMYQADTTLSEIPAFFARAWRALPAESKVIDPYRGFLDFDCLTTFVRAGGEDYVSLAREILEVYHPTPGTAADDSYTDGGSFSAIIMDVSVLDAFAESTDPLVGDMMIAYLRERPSSLKGEMRQAFADVLATRGDMRLLPILEASIAAARQEKAAPAQATSTRQYMTWLRFTTLRLNLANAKDKIAYILALANQDRDLIAAPAVEELARQFTEGELVALLTDTKAEPVRGLVYIALRLRRENEAAKPAEAALSTAAAASTVDASSAAPAP